MSTLDFEIDKIGKAVECTAEYFKTLYRIIDQIYPSQVSSNNEKPVSGIQNTPILQNVQAYQKNQESNKRLSPLELLRAAHGNSKGEKIKPKKSTSVPKKKREKTKDIEGVKKPTSPFFLFVEEIKTNKSEDELIAIGNIYKYAGEEWRKLTDDQRKQWSFKFDEIKQIYLKKKKELEDKENGCASDSGCKATLENLKCNNNEESILTSNFAFQNLAEVMTNI